MKLKKLLCRIVGHQVTLEKEITGGLCKVRCVRCGQPFARDDNSGVMVPWDAVCEMLAVELILVKLAEKKADVTRLANELKNKEIGGVISAGNEGLWADLYGYFDNEEDQRQDPPSPGL